MRIVQLANFVGPRSGGMRTALAALGRGYVEAGSQRLLVIPGPRDLSTSSAEGDVVCVRSPRVAGGYRLVVEPSRVIDVVRRFAPTSVEVSDKLTLTPVADWARATGVPSVLFSHERLDDMAAGYLGLGGPTRAAVRLLNRRVVPRYDDVVVTSRYAQHELQPVTDEARRRLHRIPLGVDLETFRPHPRRDPGDGPDGTRLPGRPVRGAVRLVHVGRLSREKSPDLAVGVALELHRRGVDVRLDVYGDGPRRAALAASARSAPVTFHGHVGGRDVLSRHIADAHVSISPSPIETFGLAVLEALACGTPVVTASRGGARELVDTSSGGWGEPHPGALADAVLELVARPEQELRRGARARAERYPWSATVGQMMRVHARSGTASEETVGAA